MVAPRVMPSRRKPSTPRLNDGRMLALGLTLCVPECVLNVEGAFV